MMSAKKVLLVANWDWVLYNFRFALAKSLLEKGYEVIAVCPDGKYRDNIEAAGIRWIEWQLHRRSLNPLGEISAIQKLAQIYREEKPALIHHDTIKPNFYGSLALKINKRKNKSAQSPAVINTFMGLGYLFSSHKKATALRRMLLPIMRMALNQKEIFTIFSNHKDQSTFIDLNLLTPDKTRVLVSECVNIDYFQPGAHPEYPASTASDNKPFKVLMAARLLWDKGVKEFVDAARELKGKGYAVEFLLAGLPDKANPQWVPEDTLRGWESENLIQWLGHRSDMNTLLQEVNVAVLPTHYNEGLPRFLVESASAGLPLIATDIPACKEVVKDGKNGFIIPKRDSSALADAVQKLIEDSKTRERMSRESRKLAVDEFDETHVLKDWLALYKQLTQLQPA